MLQASLRCRARLAWLKEPPAPRSGQGHCNWLRGPWRVQEAQFFPGWRRTGQGPGGGPRTAGRLHLPLPPAGWLRAPESPAVARGRRSFPS